SKAPLDLERLQQAFDKDGGSYGIAEKATGKSLRRTYRIHGMSCQGCKATVEERLLNVEGVNTVAVDLAKETAVITSPMQIPLKRLQQALSAQGASYSITTMDASSPVHKRP